MSAGTRASPDRLDAHPDAQPVDWSLVEAETSASLNARAHQQDVLVKNIRSVQGMCPSRASSCRKHGMEGIAVMWESVGAECGSILTELHSCGLEKYSDLQLLVATTFANFCPKHEGRFKKGKPSEDKDKLGPGLHKLIKRMRCGLRQLPVLEERFNFTRLLIQAILAAACDAPSDEAAFQPLLFPLISGIGSWLHSDLAGAAAADRTAFLGLLGLTGRPASSIRKHTLMQKLPAALISTKKAATIFSILATNIYTAAKLDGVDALLFIHSLDRLSLAKNAEARLANHSAAACSAVERCMGAVVRQLAAACDAAQRAAHRGLEGFIKLGIADNVPLSAIQEAAPWSAAPGAPSDPLDAFEHTSNAASMSDAQAAAEAAARAAPLGAILQTLAGHLGVSAALATTSAVGRVEDKVDGLQEGQQQLLGQQSAALAALGRVEEKVEEKFDQLMKATLEYQQGRGPASQAAAAAAAPAASARSVALLASAKDMLEGVKACNQGKRARQEAALQAEMEQLEGRNQQELERLEARLREERASLEAQHRAERNRLQEGHEAEESRLLNQLSVAVAQGEEALEHFIHAHANANASHTSSPTRPAHGSRLTTPSGSPRSLAHLPAPSALPPAALAEGSRAAGSVVQRDLLPTAASIHSAPQFVMARGELTGGMAQLRSTHPGQRASGGAAAGPTASAARPLSAAAAIRPCPKGLPAAAASGAAASAAPSLPCQQAAATAGARAGGSPLQEQQVPNRPPLLTPPGFKAYRNETFGPNGGGKV